MIRFWKFMTCLNILQLAWQAIRPGGPVLIGVIAITLGIVACIFAIEDIERTASKAADSAAEK